MQTLKAGNPQARIFVYHRVSTESQKTDRATMADGIFVALEMQMQKTEATNDPAGFITKKFWCNTLERDGLFVEEKISAVKKSANERPGLNYLLQMTRPGDIFFVESLDRLSRRSMQESAALINQITANAPNGYGLTLVFVKDIGGSIILNNDESDSTAALVSNLLINVFIWVAASDQKNRQHRANQGRRAAMLRGSRQGRRPRDIDEIINRYKTKVVPAMAEMKKQGIKPTFGQVAKLFGEHTINKKGGTTTKAFMCAGSLINRHHQIDPDLINNIQYTGARAK